MKLRTQIHGAGEALTRAPTASVGSVADDTGHTIDEDEVDVVEAVIESY